MSEFRYFRDMSILLLNSAIKRKSKQRDSRIPCLTARGNIKSAESHETHLSARKLHYVSIYGKNSSFVLYVIDLKRLLLLERKILFIARASVHHIVYVHICLRKRKKRDNACICISKLKTSLCSNCGAKIMGCAHSKSFARISREKL